MSIGMQQQDRAEREKFENELKKIIEKSNEANLLMRVIGSLAFWIDAKNQGIISERIAHVLPLGGNSFLLILVTGLVGGLVAGLAAMTGAFLLPRKK